MSKAWNVSMSRRTVASSGSPSGHAPVGLGDQAADEENAVRSRTPRMSPICAWRRRATARRRWADRRPRPAKGPSLVLRPARRAPACAPPAAARGAQPPLPGRAALVAQLLSVVESGTSSFEVLIAPAPPIRRRSRRPSRRTDRASSLPGRSPAWGRLATQAPEPEQNAASTNRAVPLGRSCSLNAPGYGALGDAGAGAPWKSVASTWATKGSPSTRPVEEAGAAASGRRGWTLT